jgi:fucose permease
LIVFVVGVAIAMLGRLIVLDKGADAGTANLTFVIILGVCTIAYLIILATLAHIIVPCIMKKLPNRKKAAPTTMENSVFSEKEKTPKPSAEDIRQNYTKAYIEVI